MPMDHVDHDLAAGSPPIPLTILTGFLGAGKTTLLNRILNGDHGLRVAVLVNDFGSISIDAQLVVGVESDVISLANGCICCTLRDDLVDTVIETISRPERPEYILLEASGVTEPSGIAVTFNNPRFRDRIRLDSILCVVDAEQVFAVPDSMELKLFQIACADMVILNKVDLVHRDHVARIRAWLDDRFHRYRLVEACQADVPLAVLLSVGRLDPTRVRLDLCALDHDGCNDARCNHERHRSFPHYPVSAGHSDHAKGFSTWSYETVQPLSLEALRRAASRLPANIYRAKGVIHSADAPDRRAVLQVVGRRVDISLEDGWRDRPPRTQIVAIGAPGAIDGEELRAAFEQCAGAQGGRGSREGKGGRS